MVIIPMQLKIKIEKSILMTESSWKRFIGVLNDEK